jgi:UDP-N-acetyl-D-galactosamine dehydrogenase
MIKDPQASSNLKRGVALRKIAVVGLGCGLPMTVAFGRAAAPAIGFDIIARRMRELKADSDTTREIDPDVLNRKALLFRSNPSQLKTADLFVVTLPTPIEDPRQLYLTALLRASTTVGRALKSGDIVVYE